MRFPHIQKKHLYIALAGILALCCIVILIINIHKLSKHARLAEELGQKIVYSISQDTIINTTPVVDATTPAASNELSAAPITKPSIAIIISDLGLSATSTKNSLSLSPEITFGLSPYGQNFNDFTNSAANLGHDILLRVPMEPVNYPLDDPGPYALFSNLSNAEIISKLQFLQAKDAKINGIYSLGNDKFTSSWDNVQVLLQYAQSQNLLFVYGGNLGNDVINQTADKLKFPLLTSDLTLDSELLPEAIQNKLIQLEDLARKNGYAIAIARPYPITINLLKSWTETLSAKGIELIRISKLTYYKSPNNNTQNKTDGPKQQ